jgi:hypothetical protein
VKHYRFFLAKRGNRIILIKMQYEFPQDHNVGSGGILESPR